MKKRWYLLLIAAGLLLCAVPLQSPQHLPKPVFALLAAGGSVLVGGSLGSLLCRVIRIRDPVLVQAYKEQHDERNTMICEKAAARAALGELEADLRREYQTTDPELFLRAEARAARVMQGAVLYFGAAYARFLELPMWITWGLVGFCLAWGLLEWGLTLWYRHRM